MMLQWRSQALVVPKWRVGQTVPRQPRLLELNLACFAKPSWIWTIE